MTFKYTSELISFSYSRKWESSWSRIVLLTLQVFLPYDIRCPDRWGWKTRNKIHSPHEQMCLHHFAALFWCGHVSTVLKQKIWACHLTADNFWLLAVYASVGLVCLQGDGSCLQVQWVRFSGRLHADEQTLFHLVFDLSLLGNCRNMADTYCIRTPAYSVDVKGSFLR